MTRRRYPASKGGFRAFRHGAALAQPQPTRFSEAIVQPLADFKESLRKGEGRREEAKIPDRLRELAASASLPPASVADARRLRRVALALLAQAGDCRNEPAVVQLKASVSKLGKLLAACSVRRRVLGVFGRRQGVPPRMMAQLQAAARDVVIYASNVSLTINAARGSHVTVYLASGAGREDKEEETKREAAPPPGSGGGGDPEEPDPGKRRTRGKSTLGIRRRTGIANCPYIFKPDRRTIVFKPTGVAYMITAPAAVHALNRLTLAMKNSADWFTKFTGKDAEAMRSACPEFLDDCVDREGVATGDGHSKWTGRARLARTPKPRK